MTATVRIRVEGTGATQEDIRQLRLWLEADPELREVAGRIGREPRPVDNAMGVWDDLLLHLAQRATGAVMVLLLRSVYNHLRNRPRRDLRVTVEMAGNLRVTVEGDRTYSRGELAEKARLAAEAIDPGAGPDSAPGPGSGPRPGPGSGPAE
ncbi:hypothetical protein AB0O69_17200 [Streptomyces xiamenensis]|uniref:effector-associated constant component EACC1 n=1 Tax=Streptomyces xiamenensis TaxID=408015 RepID=UPI00343AE2A7